MVKEYESFEKAFSDNNLGDYESKIVAVDGNLVLLCGTNKAYDEEIYGLAYELVTNLGLEEYVAVEDLSEALLNALDRSLADAEMTICDERTNY